jgi:hypothetical protein
LHEGRRGHAVWYSAEASARPSRPSQATSFNPSRTEATLPHGHATRLPRPAGCEGACGLDGSVTLLCQRGLPWGGDLAVFQTFNVGLVDESWGIGVIATIPSMRVLEFCSAAHMFKRLRRDLETSPCGTSHGRTTLRPPYCSRR